jgi:hypothetical protein
MAKQAKCVHCNVRYEWKKDYPLVGILCPRCSGPLRATSYQWSGVTVDDYPLEAQVYTIRLDMGTNLAGVRLRPVVIRSTSFRNVRDEAVAVIRRLIPKADSFIPTPITVRDGSTFAILTHDGKLLDKDPSYKDAKEINVP